MSRSTRTLSGIGIFLALALVAGTPLAQSTGAGKPAAVPTDGTEQPTAEPTAEPALQPVEKTPQPGFRSYQEPEYPRLAKRHGIEGRVVAKLTFDRKGEVTEAQIVSGHRAFHRAVLDAVEQWSVDMPSLSESAPPLEFQAVFDFRLGGR